MKRKGIYKVYQQEREKGLTYREIAEKYGVTWQNVQCACGTRNPCNFQFFSDERCVYVNLRKWLNVNKVSTSELLRRCGIAAAGKNQERMRLILKGKTQPRKPTIDKLIAVTGLPYEKLFEQDVEVKE